MGERNLALKRALNWWEMSKEEQIRELESQISWMKEDLENLKEQLRNLLDE